MRLGLKEKPGTGALLSRLWELLCPGLATKAPGASEAGEIPETPPERMPS